MNKQSEFTFLRHRVHEQYVFVRPYDAGRRTIFDHVRRLSAKTPISQALPEHQSGSVTQTAC